MRLDFPLALAISALLAGAGVTAQTPGAATQNPTQAQTDDLGVRIEGDYYVIGTGDDKTGIPLRQFVGVAHRITRLTFHVNWTENPAADTERVSLIGPMRVRKDSFFSFFQTILYIKNYAIVPRGANDTLFYELIFLPGARRMEIKKAAKWVHPDEIPQYATQTGTYLITSIPVKYIDPNRATNTLRPFFQLDQAGMDNMAPVGNAKAILVTGFGPTIYAIDQMLKLVDVKEDVPKPDFRRIPLEHAAVDELEPILNELMSERARSPARPASPEQGISGQMDPAESMPWKVVSDQRTNSLLVMAHKDRLIEIQNLVVELDTPIDDVSSDFRVYPVRNVNAKDLQTVLQDFLTRTQQSEQAARAGAPAAGAGGATAGGRRTAPPVVVSDTSSNSLLITASQSKWEELSVLINRLDKRQPQVLIETALIELATDDAARFGVELGLLDIGTGDFTTGFGFTSFGLSQFQDTDGNGLPDTRVPDFENPLRGVTGGILRSQDFAIPIIANALQSDRQANVLSIPSVLVNNNKNATVISQAEVATSTSSQNVSGTQTGFAGFQPAGIELKISPSISSANYLRLNVDLKVSKFQGTSADPAIPPPRTTRQIITEVTMPSGHTMVLGGVIEDSSADSEEGIPFLKDIPLLGWLFKRWDNSHSKTNLYFFITPHILVEEDFSDLAEMTFRKKVEASEYIGHRRLQIVDRSWRGSDVLEDTGSTLEQIDKLGGFDIPAYQKPELTPETEKARRQGQKNSRNGQPGSGPGGATGTRDGPSGPPGPRPEAPVKPPETRPGAEQR